MTSFHDFSKLRHLRLLPLIWAIPGQAEVLPEVRITEFLAVNDEGIRDEDGDRSDWIEIWNASGVIGDLEGWYLTDDPSRPAKWRFPAREMGANERIVVFASDKDRDPIEGELHTNFRLQAEAGGYLALVRPDGLTVASEFGGYAGQEADISYGVVFPVEETETLLAEGAQARWLVPDRDLAGWTEPGFDDQSWSTATTGIGYDVSGDYAGHFAGGGPALEAAMKNFNASVFIRIPFSYTPRTGGERFVLRMKWEDGFAAFLNGREITRQRAPGQLEWNSTSEPATGRDESEAVSYDDHQIESGDMREGGNVLAIHGLNQSTGSSDFLISPQIEVARVDLNAGVPGYFIEPTPGEANETERFDGLVADTRFSVDRGSFSQAFNLEITSATPGASIRFTLDGTEPSPDTGLLYSGPILIAKTTVVRAMAFQAGFFPTNVDTQTYLFPADVINQTEMRPAITGHPEWGPQMRESLGALPSLALSFDGDDVNRRELPVSVELLDFENGGHQIDAGAVRVGGFFTDYDKHSIRLHFRSRYGAKRMEYPVFANRNDDVPAVTSFDALDVRAGNQDMVHRGAYLSNMFADDSMLAMGQPGPRGRFVHLYFNGNYRGLYHLRERFHAAMISDYEAGPEEEYTTIDAVNQGNFFSSGVIQNGDGSDWNQILSDLQGVDRFERVRSRLNVENLIDFMLLWTSGSCESEFRAVGSPQNGFPFVFHMKDADGFLRPPDLVDNDPRNRTFAYVHLVTHPGPADAMSRLRAEGNPEFKMLLADRIHRHFFNDGALTPAKHIARLERLVNMARLPYIAEAARWGFHDGTPNRNPDQWEAYQQDILQNQFPVLAAGQIAKFKASRMYPDVEAPVFSQHGGSLSPGEGVVLAGSSEVIYYTLDGKDPRSGGGDPSPSALEAVWDANQPGPEDFIESGDSWRYLADGSNQGVAWRDAGFDDRGWPEGPSELGYGEGDEATVLAYVDTDPDAPGIQRNATTYFRKEIMIGDPRDFPVFTLSIKYDDGFAVFVNGTEVARANLASDAAFNTFADGNSPDETAFFDFAIPVSAFVADRNVIAVEMHNASAFSGDVSFDLKLRGEAPGGDTRLTEEVIPDGPVFLKARSFDPTSGEWSALNEAFFSVNSVPASAENLVISEIHYRPAEPEEEDEIAISRDRDDYEFIELYNRGSLPVELGGVAFTDGITFSFPGETLLNAGERLVLVRDEEAFRARYGDLAIAGIYSGRLSNGGERLVLSRDGEVILSFVYDDRPPWPVAADGSGSSMFLLNPDSFPDPGNGFHWRAHRQLGGAPGQPDLAGGFDEWMAGFGITSGDGDEDDDGISDLLEYLLGSSPIVPSPEALPVPGMETVEGQVFPTLDFEVRPDSYDVSWEIQSSDDLQNWTTDDFVQVSTGHFRRTLPATVNESSRYYRIRVRLIQ